MFGKLRSLLALACVSGTALAAGLAVPAAANQKVVIGVPGDPPIFAAVIVYVAAKQGFFKTHGVDVEIKPFPNGMAALDALTKGGIDLSMGPTPPIIKHVREHDDSLVGIYGMNHPDWIVGSLQKDASCKTFMSEPVGIDTPGGARYTALKMMIASGCPGIDMAKSQEVMDHMKMESMGSHAGSEMAAGHLRHGVLHLDDIAMLKARGKPATVVLEMSKTHPNAHYLLFAASRDKLNANREAYVGTLAGLIEAARFMQSEQNADAVAHAARPTGHDLETSKLALKDFLGIGFWSAQDNGMDRTKVEATIAKVDAMGVKPGAKPMTYERLVDETLWRDANAKVKVK